MYVLVLGLDVLGNPFGLIRGLSEGVEAFFYEPYQVTIDTLAHGYQKSISHPVCSLTPPLLVFDSFSVLLQGAIQGPEEFVEGMALGVKALVGGAVGEPH